MCRKLFCLTSFVLVLWLGMGTSSAYGQEGLIGYWKLDETSGTTAEDSAGGDNNGTLSDNVEWQPGGGMFGGALLYDGTNTAHVEFPSTGMSATSGTVAMWGYLSAPQPAQTRYFFGHTTQPPYNNRIQLYMDNSDTELDLGLGSSHTLQTGIMILELETWYHVALTWDNGDYVVYVNGEEVASGTYTGLAAIHDFAWFGNDGNPETEGTEAFGGLLDEVRLYNRALNAVEILASMTGEPFTKASGPIPKDGALYPDTWVSLSWRPGDFAVSHDVYLGDNFADVNDGVGDTLRSNQTDAFYVAGFPGFAFPEGLIPGATYYWRIDEVNDAEPNSPWKGDVWSFSIPPKTAYSPVPADDAEFIPMDATLTWTAGFGAILHYVYFGEDFDTVNNATGGEPLGVESYSPGPLQLAKTYYWRVDEFDAASTHKGDVWSFTTEGAVSGPNPSNGAVDVKPTVVLSWDAGAVAASHEVYFGTDADAVKNATNISPEYKGPKALGEESYDPGKLMLNTAYYWRIDEVNGISPDSPWAGNVWSFTTGDFYVIDDFEDYDTDENQIWYAWHDGLGYGVLGTDPYFAGNGTGAAVGDETTASFTEETIVNGGLKAMPVMYNNNKQGYAYYSEAELTLSAVRDWTEEGVTELSLWFRGNPSSVGSFTEAPIGTYTMTASGTDIWNDADEFHYAFKTLSGVGTIVAQVLSVDNTDPWAKAGVMFRDTLEPGSKFAAVYITPGSGCRFQARVDADAAATSDTSVVTSEQTAITAPYWIKLERDFAGNFRGYYSSNGSTWQMIAWGAQNISMGSNIYIGLAVTSHNAAATCEGKFSNVTITGTAGAQWMNQDIGIASNDAEPLYVALSNSAGTPAVVVHDDPAAANIDTWTEWIIPLQAFADQGISLTNVDRIAVGMGTKGNMTIPGGSGKMYFDDIRLNQPKETAE
ncbi:LamG domain-containing protein [Planctomycetota bacterium]